MVNWGAGGMDALSGAATGASIGSIVPGIGTAIGAGIGGIVGGLSGLFGGGSEGASASDQFTGGPQNANPVAMSLMQSRAGADAANSITSRVLNRSRLNVAQGENSAAVQGNTAVRNALYNSQMGEGYNAASDAATKGAVVDQGAKEEGARLLQSGSQFDRTFDYNAWTARHNAMMQPSPLDVIGGKVLGNVAGNLATRGADALGDKLFGPKKPPDTTTGATSNNAYDGNYDGSTPDIT